jgi:hypothetical protein
VYKLLEATPQGGREFAKAVREVLAREMTWVDWKKGRVLGEFQTNCSRASAQEWMWV